MGYCLFRNTPLLYMQAGIAAGGFSEALMRTFETATFITLFRLAWPVLTRNPMPRTTR